MKNKNLITGLLGLMPILGMAQVGINTDNPVVSLHIEPSSKTNPRSTDGILIPKIKNFPVQNPTVKGMLVFLEGHSTLPNNFYFWDGSRWVPFLTAVNKTFDETVHSFNGTGFTNGYLNFSSANSKSPFPITDNRTITIQKRGTYLVQLSSSIKRNAPTNILQSNSNYSIHIDSNKERITYRASIGYPLERTSGSSIISSFVEDLEVGDLISVQYEGTGGYNYTSFGMNNLSLTYIHD